MKIFTLHLFSCLSGLLMVLMTGILETGGDVMVIVSDSNLELLSVLGKGILLVCVIKSESKNLC